MRNNNVSISFVTTFLSALLALALGCHASEDDPAGLADELSDPQRRTHSIEHLIKLHDKALQDASGDRDAASVKAVRDASVEKLVKAYLDNPHDAANRKHIIDLLANMRDPRALPAFLEALKWRAEVNEDSAVTAAKALTKIELSEADRKKAIEALATALGRISGKRGADNRMRIQFIQSLGYFKDPAAIPALLEAMNNQSDDQAFEINRLAAEQIGRLADPATVPHLVRGLFLFDVNQPGKRMNDVAATGLVRIGKPSVKPLIAVLEDKDKDAHELAARLLGTYRKADPKALPGVTVQTLLNQEATFALGALGLEEARAALEKEMQAEDYGQRLNAAIALRRLPQNDAQMSQLVDSLMNLLNQAEGQEQAEAKQAQIVAQMRHTYSDAVVPKLVSVAKNTDFHPVVRLKAVEGVAMLGNESELKSLNAWAESANKDAYQQNFLNELKVPLREAKGCGDIACWSKKLESSDAAVARKAAYMLGRLGRGNAEAIKALVAHLDHAALEARLAVVAALDHVAVNGSKEAVEKIDALREKEEGQSMWTNFSREANPVQERLRHRSGK